MFNKKNIIKFVSIIIITLFVLVVIIFNSDSNVNSDYKSAISTIDNQNIIQVTSAYTETTATLSDYVITTTFTKTTSCITTKETTITTQTEVTKLTTTSVTIITVDNSYEDINLQESNEQMRYYGTFKAKWYDNKGLGYSENRSLNGYYGRNLISGYSVASNYFPGGTILYIKGGCHNGYYRVDDTGEMSDNIIDFYYKRRLDVPQDFRYNGVYNIEVYVVN